jgi:predicted DNA-binding transcriptional regulator YafY
VNTIFAKLDAFVPTELVEKLDRVKTLFVSSENFAKDYSGKEDVIDSLTDAMLQQKTSYVKYHSFTQDRISNFTIDPLYFFESQGGLYVFVRATSFNEIKILAVERIQELTLTENHFEYPNDFDPDEKLNEAFDMVYDDSIEARIWISDDQAKYVTERRLVKNQKVIYQDDGSIVLEIKTSGWWDLKRWVLSFGANAEVLEPMKLREEIAKEIKTLNSTYAG